MVIAEAKAKMTARALLYTGTNLSYVDGPAIILLCGVSCGARRDGGEGMASGVSCGARRDGGRRLNGARCVVPKVCRLLYRTMSIMKGDRPWR